MRARCALGMLHHLAQWQGAVAAGHFLLAPGHSAHDGPPQLRHAASALHRPHNFAPCVWEAGWPHGLCRAPISAHHV